MPSRAARPKTIFCGRRQAETMGTAPLAKSQSLLRTGSVGTGERFLLAMLVLVVVLQVELIFSKSINWDEFFHFSQINQQLLGRPVPWLQSPFVALFLWIPALPGDNIDHIQWIRLLLLPFELVTIAAIVSMARRLASGESALLCGLLFATGGYVFLHGFALRADMIAACLLSLAMWVGLCRPLRAAALMAIALLLSLAFVSTIKAVLYAPAFLGIALFRLDRARDRLAFALAVGTATLAAAALLWAVPQLPASGATGPLRDMSDLGRDSIARMFSDGLFPQMWALQAQIVLAPLLAVAILLAAVHACMPGRNLVERLLLLSLLAPLATIAIYRNAYPYHFAFILPPAMVAIAPAIDPLIRRLGIAVPAAFLVAGALLLSVSEDRSVLPRQRAIVAGIHDIFPQPVTYIDNSGMAGDFPRAVNHFASGWSLAIYHRAGRPQYSEALATEPVPMVLANNATLRRVFSDVDALERLLPGDERTLRETYIPHWGRIYVAGKHVPAGNDHLTFLVRVPGIYTVEGGPLVVDGRSHAVGGLLRLSRGVHMIGGHRPSAVTLRWGDHLARPAIEWPEGPMYTAY
jgi:hypothetical protein